MMMMMTMIVNCFCGMVDRRKVFSLIWSQDHYQKSSPLQISNMPQVIFEHAQNLSSGLVELSCAVVITTTPWHHHTPSSSSLILLFIIYQFNVILFKMFFSVNDFIDFIFILTLNQTRKGNFRKGGGFLAFLIIFLTLLKHFSLSLDHLLPHATFIPIITEITEHFFINTI